MRNFLRGFLSIGFCLFLVLPHAHADNDLTPEQKARIKPLIDAANQATIVGPASIPLFDEATLDLPKGYGFVPQKEAAALMGETGNKEGENFIGVIVPITPESPKAFVMSKEDEPKDAPDWVMTLDFAKTGYIRDGEAKNWNPDKMLQAIQNGVQKSNADRQAKGFPGVEVTGWLAPPNYDSATHHLIFSLKGNMIGKPGEPLKNYETFVLGRDGFIALELVSDTLDKDIPSAREILSAIHYNNGKRYEDFNAQNDKIAEFGLAALVTGLAAKKLGLLAVAGLFFVKIWKAILLVVAVVLAKFKKKKPPQLGAPAAPPPQDKNGPLA